ncbi:hypothetical protein NPIL_39501 [Nephila pilipes]|uniref:Uncharacterized protein n=1 Tax=Nephila pilipes TaxID=299642 RepID=A0A8X6URS3_NEPPI|nr:hypothetical protein NPIL_39501 [Nephila pilipes]
MPDDVSVIGMKREGNSYCCILTEIACVVVVSVPTFAQSILVKFIKKSSCFVQLEDVSECVLWLARGAAVPYGCAEALTAPESESEEEATTPIPDLNRLASEVTRKLLTSPMPKAQSHPLTGGRAHTEETFTITPAQVPIKAGLVTHSNADPQLKHHKRLVTRLRCGLPSPPGSCTKGRQMTVQPRRWEIETGHV